MIEKLEAYLQEVQDSRDRFKRAMRSAGTMAARVAEDNNLIELPAEAEALLREAIEYIKKQEEQGNGE